MERRRRSSGADSPLRRDRVMRTSELRRTLRLGSFLVALALLGTGILFAARFPDHAALLFVTWASCGLAGFGLCLTAGRAPHRLVVPLTVLLTMLPAIGLLVTAVEPGAMLGIVSGSAIVPVAVPLFLPWTRALRTGWSLSYAVIFGAVSLVTGFGYLTASQRVDVTISVVVGTLIGWIGAELLERLRTRNLEQENELLRLNRELLRRATTDALTGLANRRQLDNDLQILSTSRATGGGSYAFIMLDLDQFKRLNDQLGHAAGDAALRDVSAELRRVVREGDTIYRYGGEEFLVIMPNTTLEEAAMAANRIRLAIADLRIGIGPGATAPGLTISGGVAFSTLARQHWESVLAAADSALYEAKAMGRNRVCVVPGAVGDDISAIRDWRVPPRSKPTPIPAIR